MIVVAPTARISSLADVEDSIRGTRIVIGDATIVDAFVKIKPACGLADVVIGSNCVLNSGVVIYSGNGVTIGDSVLIAANCTLAPVNHAYGRRDRLIREQGFPPGRGGIVVEDDVWIGANSVLLDGARVRRGAVLGAGSIVRGEIASYGVFAGQPLRRIGSRT